jgi:hypothetical protein
VDGLVSCAQALAVAALRFCGVAFLSGNLAPVGFGALGLVSANVNCG